MKVYAVIFEDRHCDVDVELFHNAEKAIERAKEFAHKNDRHDQYEEKAIEGYIFYATYSCEGDCATVLERDVS